MENFKIPAHPVQFTELGVKSRVFDDIFHSSHGIADEVHSVYLQGNNLPNRWAGQNLDFTISELGFGFALSFLITAFEWIKINHNKNFLRYVGIDAYPISLADLKKFYLAYDNRLNFTPENKIFLNDFFEAYPPLMRGTHKINLTNYSIELTLIFDDALAALKSHKFKSDAWYLDGFSPNKNKEIWSSEIFAEISNKSYENSTFSTYSVSRIVKDNAALNKFTFKKTDGFGSKKKMLEGFSSSAENKNNRKIKTIAIIGGGISGISQAYALRGKNFDISIFEEKECFSSGASGNKAAVIMPLVSSKLDPLCVFYVLGYLHTLRELKLINKDLKLRTLNLNGALRLASVKKWESVKSKFIELGLDHIGQIFEAEELNKIFKLSQDNSGIKFNDGGSVEPRELINGIYDYYLKDFTCHFNTKIECVTYTNNGYLVRTNKNEVSNFDCVIICNAFNCVDLAQTAWIPIEKIKGQLFTTTNLLKGIDIPICYNGYAIPLDSENKMLVGATYEHNRHEEDFNPDVTSDLLKRFEKNTGIPCKTDQEIYDGKVCFRTTSPDRLPVIGQMVGADGGRLENLFVNIGHGSRGMVSCFIAGDLVASLICDSPLPLPSTVVDSVSVKRFFDRSVRRDKSLEEIYPASFAWRC